MAFDNKYQNTSKKYLITLGFKLNLLCAQGVNELYQSVKGELIVYVYFKKGIRFSQSTHITEMLEYFNSKSKKIIKSKYNELANGDT